MKANGAVGKLKLDIKGLMNKPGPGKGMEPPPADPPVRQLIEVDIERIETCDLNPRQQEDAVFFARLCESIRVDGLECNRDADVLDLVDSYGIELIHPVRRGRSPGQFGGAGISNHRWIAGAKWCVVVPHLGEIIGWVWAPANAHDTWFRPLLDVFDGRTALFSDTGFHSAQGDPANLKVCRRGERNDRMLIETVLSMLTVVCHAKKMRHRLAEYFQVHVGLMAAAFNLLIGWSGLSANGDGFVPLSIAEFSL